jgi:hypothetical protein
MKRLKIYGRKKQVKKAKWQQPMEMDLGIKLECKKTSKLWLGKTMVMVDKITHFQLEK